MVTIGGLISWFVENGNECITNSVNLSLEIIKPWAIDNATAEHISFIGSKHTNTFQKTISAANCKIIIVDKKLLSNNTDTGLPQDVAFVISENPKFDLIAMCNALFPEEKPIAPLIHPSAVISDKVFLGENVCIAPNVVIGEGVTIGDNCTIDAGTLLKKNVTVGSNSKIGASTVIGGVGFGYSKNEMTEAYEQFPHFGGVIIGSNVSIGSNTCIDRGSLSDTIIEDGVKIDNLVHIAHNVVVGKNSLVIACSMIAGSTIIGENCWIAPSSTVRNGITIGDNTTVGLASTVTKNVEGNQTIIGSPAMGFKDYIILRKRLKELMES